MICDIIESKIIKDYQVFLKFDNGKEGIADIAALIKFEINSDIGTICWQNGADISPAFLYNNLR